MLFRLRLWKSFLLVFGIPVPLFGIVVTFVSGPRDGVVVLGLFAVLWAVVGAVIDGAGGFTASYLVTAFPSRQGLSWSGECRRSGPQRQKSMNSIDASDRCQYRIHWG